MAYFRGVSTRPRSLTEYPTVEAGNWACEYVLLMAWEHRGLMGTMQTPCELALLNAGCFLRILRTYPDVRDFCRCYATMLAQEAQSSITEMTDFPISLEEARSLSNRT